ncbi:hypothetical protein AAC387_Pa05g1386 [Persea americana]
MQYTLIGQFLDCSISTRILTQRLPTLWRLQGDLEVLELPKGFSMFKFAAEADLCRAREGSPWTVTGSRLGP